MNTQPSADPYLPGHGDPSYTVDHYDLDIDYTLLGNRLDGRATLTVRSLVDGLDSLTLDLHHLKVVSVRGVRTTRHTHRRGRLVLQLAEPLASGQTAEVIVAYRGVPKVVRDKAGDAGWEELEDGAIVASQPGGAPSWFPCNDRTDAKATYRITIAAPADYYVVANGVRTDRRRRSSRTVWSYEQRELMAPYLATVQIGLYAEHEISGCSVPLSGVVAPSLRARFDEAFADQPRMIAEFERLFGPYPFATYRAVVTTDELEIPLEAQGLSVFGSNLLDRDWESQRLIAHELAHQWFGNAVTLRLLRDIWLHEGFACYSEWLWSEASGNGTADERARRHHAELADLKQNVVLGDPGVDDVFDDRVYKRGALALHAIRLTCGDTAFFGMLRAWVERHRYGNVTTAEFEALVDELCGSSAAGLVHGWVYSTDLPDLPAR
ncbi:putative peptidase M1, membrane alanine aminopeptidase [Flexivirga endophytica]|uniref:Aminopeptidase N n=1 Tax=Flexivirga endophytica TaxID=1849103 RepID=A0A916T9H5_9MICO|nr:M1 family metallopeptidase [Flexivirga endophytica]GGB36887.1 putative peptidase M1, membrane alanine aminopeptidase [Flexivirga endophytica]GHB44441.1 putative peptidase M1, membrane alanine aminopeptidase [Flexivirga endophytica]